MKSTPILIHSFSLEGAKNIKFKRKTELNMLEPIRRALKLKYSVKQVYFNYRERIKNETSNK